MFENICFFCYTFVDMFKEKRKLVLIDTFALAHRSFHALPLMYSPSHEPVNSVYGLALTVIKVLRELKPEFVAACTDLPTATFRHEEFKAYKAHRKEAPAELLDQIPKIYQFFEALSIPVYSKEGFEADDIIGTIAKKACKISDLEVIIVTGDYDTLQLVSDCVKVYAVRKSISDTVLMGSKEVKEKYGFSPELIIDYKALRGDPSDNIPGVPGIGEKTARELIAKFGTIEKLYQNLEKLDIRPRVKKLLKAHRTEAFLSKKLSTIQSNVKVDFKLSEVKFKPNKEKIIKFFQKLGFRSLIGKLDALNYQTRNGEAQTGVDFIQSELFAKEKENNKEIRAPCGCDYLLVDNEKKLKVLARKLEESKEFSVDVETDSLDSMNSTLIGISFSTEAGKAWYVPIEIKSCNSSIKKRYLSLEEIKKFLSSIFKSSKLKVGQNLKFDLQVMERHGLEIAPPYFDTMVASYIQNPGTKGHSLDNLAFTLLGHQMIPIEALIGSGRSQISMAQVPVEKVAVYSAEDADFTLRLKKVLEQKFTPEMAKVFYEIEMPLLPILSKMQLDGVKIDRKFLANMSQKLDKRLGELERQIHKLAGVSFNINSPQQLSEVLFKKLRLSSAGVRKTTLGRSTAADFLEKLRGDHEIIEPLMEYRELFKLKSTYIDAIPELCDRNGRVHTSFNQTVTTTGRLSSSNPNLQNIPVRTEVGREIRKAFVAEKGYKLLAADYSQIELRVVAHLAKEANMIAAFQKDIDIHAATAKLVFGQSEITPRMRRVAKTINFGVLYGMSPYGLAKTLDISDEEAKKFINDYFAKFPGIQVFMEGVLLMARNKGYVETLFGRRRYLPEIHASVPQVRMAAERMAVNMPVQGTAADIMKLAMIKLDQKLKETRSGARILLQVHDELVLEVPEKEIESVSALVKKTMENVVLLSVPLVVEIKTGSNWGEMS